MTKRRTNVAVAVPRYRVLADRLIEDIREGVLAVGKIMPGEIELSTRFKVSRHTIREALRVLDDLGLINRRQGIGTVVRASESKQAYVQTVTLPAELMQYPPDARLSVIETQEIKVNRKLAHTLGCRSGARWLRVSAVRKFKDDRLPINWVDVYLLPEFASIVPGIGKRASRVYQLIQGEFGVNVARVALEIRASLIPNALTEILKVQPGTPSLTVVRRYTSADKRLFLVSVSEHPADRYIYSLQLSRGWKSGTGESWS